MSQFKGIPILSTDAAAAAGEEPARSGEKYRTPQGFTAIKDGIKADRQARPAASAPQAHLVTGAARERARASRPSSTSCASIA